MLNSLTNEKYKLLILIRKYMKRLCYNKTSIAYSYFWKIMRKDSKVHRNPGHTYFTMVRRECTQVHLILCYLETARSFVVPICIIDVCALTLYIMYILYTEI